MTERAFMQSLIFSVLGILLCVAALCPMTYAWFVGSTEKTGNTVMAGSFDLTVTVLQDGTEVDAKTLPNEENNVWTWELSAGTYTVHLKPKTENTVKGHCIVTVGGEAPKHTAAIVGENAKTDAFPETPNPFVFTLTVTESTPGGKTAVTFSPVWGMAASPDIAHESAGTP